ncbi:hypothetical protein O0880_12455 [Janthinobacterium sp. SUN118]|nr:hypothetical protein [Janthinobacterium sp. SUN118]
MVKIMRKDKVTLPHAWHPGAAARARSLIGSASWRSPRPARDLLLLFCFSWLATLLPLLPHQVPTLWLWGALSGACLVTTSWLLFHLHRRRSAIWSLLGCSALISIASLGDFWRVSPVFLLSQCRSAMQEAFLTGIWRHIEFHFQWFPITTVAMLLWICLGFHAVAVPEQGSVAAGTGWWLRIRRGMRAQILPRLAYCLLMLFCMAMAMSGFESLGIVVQKNLSADGFVCAMLCGMSLYHLVLTVYVYFSAHRYVNFSLER